VILLVLSSEHERHLMTLLLCIGLFFSTNSDAGVYFTEETVEKEFIDLFVLYINNECHARNFGQRIWYLFIFLRKYGEFIIYFLSIGDASVCKLIKDVPIPDIQSREVHEKYKLIY
jgi:hypothetical protein